MGTYHAVADSFGVEGRPLTLVKTNQKKMVVGSFASEPSPTPPPDKCFDLQLHDTGVINVNKYK